MQKQSVTAQLRESLFETLNGLKNGSVSVETANAVSKISSNIISTVIVEIQAAQAVGSHNVDSVNGITTENLRDMKGGVIHKLKG